MESLIETTFYLVVFLFLAAIALLLFDWIMGILCEMLGLSWKRILMWASAVFGALWLRDYLNKKRNKAEEEIKEELKKEE